MPSPMGHALGGLAAGWAVRGAPGERGQISRDLVVFGSIGAIPDIDLLFGAHSGPTHGLGAAVVAGLLAWLWIAARGRPALVPALACAAAYASHTLLDWLGTDTAPPIGIMALWPLTRDYYQSSLYVFRGVSRQITRPELFWIPNLRTLARELLILLPTVALVGFVRRHRPTTTPPQQPFPDP